MSDITLESLLPQKKMVDDEFKSWAVATYNQAISDCLTALQQAQAKGQLIIVQEGEQWVKLPSEMEMTEYLCASYGCEDRDKCPKDCYIQTNDLAKLILKLMFNPALLGKGE